ncbi:hypothetical protein BDV09DRAFT_200142 [Aspergillus tetrazonus]
MRYQHSDIDEITTFLQDFGMSVAKRTDSEVWYRGYGEDHHIKISKEPEDYHRLLRSSSLVTLQEEAIWSLRWLVQVRRNSRIITKQRNLAFADFSFGPGPAGVHKLGHPGLCTTQLSKVSFYTTNFNLVPSDFLYVGKRPTNQRRPLHTLTLARHTSTTTASLSTATPHPTCTTALSKSTSLTPRNWATSGLRGRATSPSGALDAISFPQIFYYWWDTTGNTIEHYADGDLVNDQTPVEYGPADDESLAVWGAEVPSWFFQ